MSEDMAERRTDSSGLVSTMTSYKGRQPNRCLLNCSQREMENATFAVLIDVCLQHLMGFCVIICMNEPVNKTADH